MWVRSQDKMKLIKCKNLEISLVEEPYILLSTMDKKIKEHLGQWQIKDYNSVLGYYSTKEKALTVLDKIETHLELLEYKTCGREVIFPMPQDDEVKI